MNAIDAVRAALRLSYDWNRMLAEDLRDAPLARPTPNGGNHPLWVVGHAAVAQATLFAFITGEPNPLSDWDQFFGIGSKPLDDADVCPPYADVMDAWEREHRRMMAYVDGLAESDLARPPAFLPDDLRDNPDFATVGRLLIFTALHEMSHRAQLADARHALGRAVLAF